MLITSLFYIFTAIPSAAQSIPSPSEPGFDIIVLGGQSNGNGRGWPDLLDDEVVDPVPSFLRTDRIRDKVVQVGRLSGQDMQIIPAEYYLHHNHAVRAEAQEGILQNENIYGFGYSLSLRLATKIPANRKILIVPVAKGATSLLEMQKPPNETVSCSATEIRQSYAAYIRGKEPTPTPSDWFEKGCAYQDTIQRVTFAMSQTLPEQISTSSNRVIGIFWQHGEADVWATSNSSHRYHSEVTQNASDAHLWTYKAALKQMIEDLNFDISLLGQTSCVPFFIGNMSRHFEPFNNTTVTPRVAVYRQYRRNEEITKELPCVYNVISTGLRTNPQEDNSFPKRVHFTARSQNIMAYRYFRKFIEVFR